MPGTYYLTCQECQATFKTSHPHQKCCSRKCQGIAYSRNAKRIKLPSRGGIVENSCKQCGRTFLSFRSQHRELCGNACRAAWQCNYPIRYWLGKKRLNMSGDKHPQWKGGKAGRYGKLWDNIQVASLERDNHKCQICGNTNRLEVHHVIPVRNFLAMEFAHSLNNCVTLCKSCHCKLHHHTHPLATRLGENQYVLTRNHLYRRILAVI